MTAEGLAPRPERRVYTVEELNKTIQAALQASFPGSVWVRGEVQRLPADAVRRKHVYFELHDTSGGGAADYQIPVALLEWDRRTFGLGRYLDGSDPDLQLRDKLEVCLECRVDFYPPYGKLSLKVVGIDPSFTLGRLEEQRRRVLAFLQREGLLERNAALPLPELPLRVGLITAAGSAAERDFRSGLDASPYPFAVELVGCRMQGERTEAQVTAALTALASRGVDVIVVTRGGGSRGDLSWFDQRGIAVAVATCPVPVLTAIGHEIDRSIADVVAHRSCKTPTAAAEFLVARIDAAAERLADLAAAVAAGADAALTAAAGRLQDAAAGLERRVGRRVTSTREELARSRARLAATAAGRLAAGRAGQGDRERRLRRITARRLDSAGERLARLRPRLGAARLLAAWPRRRRELAAVAGRCARLAAGRLAAAGRALEGLAGQARLLDPARLLARGFTVTLDAAGRPIRSAGAVRRGERIRTRLHDGRIESVVTGGGSDEPRRRRDKGGQRGGTQEGEGQGSLFS